MPGRKQKGIKNDTREVFLERKRALNFFFKVLIKSNSNLMQRRLKKAQLRRPIRLTTTISTLKWILPGITLYFPHASPFFPYYFTSSPPKPPVRYLPPTPQLWGSCFLSVRKWKLSKENSIDSYYFNHTTASGPLVSLLYHIATKLPWLSLQPNPSSCAQKPCPIGYSKIGSQLILASFYGFIQHSTIQLLLSS